MSVLNSSLKKAALYARYSSDMQTENSIEAQKMAIYRFANNNGYEIVEEYIDRAKSGMSTKGRSEFKRMISESGKGEFDYVIVHKFDRFARSLNDTTTYKTMLKMNGVSLISVLEPTGNRPEDIIFEALYAAMAEYYSRNLAREVMKGMEVKAKNCEHTGGKPPYGYDVNYKTKKLVINEEEASAVRIMYKMFLENYSYTEIAQKLNELGYRTKAGNKFGKNSFYEILRNKKYCGYYVYNRASSHTDLRTRNNHKEKSDDEIISIKGGVPAIIDEETYDKALKKIKANKSVGAKYFSKRIYLLSGLVKCGVCGCNMTGCSRKGGVQKKDGTYHYTNSYRCKHTRLDKCGNSEIKQEAIEEFVLAELEKHIFNEENIPHILENLRAHYANKTKGSAVEMAHIDKMLAKCEVKKQNIVKAITNGVDSELFKKELHEISEDIKNLTERKSKLALPNEMPQITEETLREAIRKFSKVVQTRNIPECKKFISDYVEEVVVYKDRVEVALRVTSSSLCDCFIKSSIPRKAIMKLNKAA